MNVTNVRRVLMNVVLGLATAFIFAGFAFGNEALVVVGWIHAITYMLWQYGQTLYKP